MFDRVVGHQDHIYCVRVVTAVHIQFQTFDAWFDYVGHFAAYFARSRSEIWYAGPAQKIRFSASELPAADLHAGIFTTHAFLPEEHFV